MLIEFSVENFMCFKNEVTFSFEAMEDLAEDKFYNPESRRDIGIEGIGLINTVNGIYGKNASGKSSLLQVMKQLFRLIMNSRKKINEDDDFEVVYYDTSKPIIFKAKFNDEALSVYSYSLHIQGEKTEAKVVYEELKNETENKTLFIRKENIVVDSDVLSNDQLDIFKNDLQKNHLAFSQPFSLFKDIRSCFSAKVNDFMGVRSRPFLRNGKQHFFELIEPYMLPAIGMPDEMQENLQLPHIKALILNELKIADFNIEDYFFEEDELVFVHKNRVKRYFGEQSDGTKKYFCLLSDITLHILDTGGLYIVDELEKALHPLLARRFINLFKNPETNPKNARLLFSSHDIMFLHHNALNGDQIWFIDRDDETNETTLYSPAEYEDFDPLNLQSDYVLGAYDAVPNTAWRN
ncbi:MAG: ATP-binding protein [Vampirovibrio sp.]